MDQFIPEETLGMLSYRSTLGRSLKQISLRSTPLEQILDDIAKYRSSYIDVLVQENLIGSRFKSEDSIIRKYEKTLRTGGGFKQCFNDVLGFRLRFDEYPEEYPDYFRVVDLRSGKKIDDGYRAVHLYYQRDNLAYPIEVQLWCGKDYSFNIWSHQYVYGVFAKFLKPLAAQGLWGNFAKQFENVDFSLRCNGFGGEPPEFLRKLKICIQIQDTGDRQTIVSRIHSRDDRDRTGIFSVPA